MEIKLAVMKKIGVSYILIFFVFLSYAHSQEVPLKDNSVFNQALPPGAKKKLNKADKHFVKAERVMEKARVYENEIDEIKNNSRRAKTRKVGKLEEKKMQKEIEAFYHYQQAHKKLYSVYAKNLKVFRLNSPVPDAGISLEKSARAAYKKSKKFRRKAENKGDIGKAYALFSDAYQFEINAINFQIDAYSHYQSTQSVAASVETSEESSEIPDTLVQEILAASEDSVNMEEPVLPEETLPETLLESIDSIDLDETIEDTVVVEDRELITFIPEVDEVKDTVTPSVSDTMMVDAIVIPEDIFFAIQILSKTSAATDAQLLEIYEGPEKPYLMRSNGYYRYLVGKFNTLFEAKVFQNNQKVEGFIVAYKNGEKIPVQEAVELIKNR